MKYFEGKDGFVWWRGVVEDRFDPLELGRCKVRIFGFHPEDKQLVPTKDLPWSAPMVSLDPGRSHSTGPKEGDWIVGFFLDGEAAQFPVMMGIVPGIPEKPADPSKGFNDPRPDSLLEGHKVPREPKKLQQHDDGSGNDKEEISPKSRFPDERFLKEPDTTRYERGWQDGEIEKTIVPLKIENVKIGQTNVPCSYHIPGVGSDKFSAPYFFTEPETPYNAKYPYNHVYFSEGGHIIEVDDTPNFERLHWYHRTGSFKEIHPNGLTVEKIVDDEYRIVLKSRYTHIEANNFETIDWGKKTHVNKDNKSGCHYDISVGKGSNFNILTEKGEVNFYVNGDINIYATGNVNVKCDHNLVAEVGGDAAITVKGNLTSNVEQCARVHVERDLVTTVNGNVSTNVEGNVIENIKGNFIRNVVGVITDTAESITRTATSMRDDAFVDHTVNTYSVNQTSSEVQINTGSHNIKCTSASHLDAENIYRNATEAISDYAFDNIHQHANNVVAQGDTSCVRTAGSAISDVGETYNLGALYANVRIAQEGDPDDPENHTGSYLIECDTFSAHGTGACSLAGETSVQLVSGAGDALVSAHGTANVVGDKVQMTSAAGGSGSGSQVYAGDNQLDD